MRITDLALRLLGATSGEQILKTAAAASGVITLPSGTTDFSATGGASQVVRQSATGGAFTVGQLAASDITGVAGVYLPLVGGTIAGSPGSLKVGTLGSPSGGILAGDLVAQRVVVNANAATAQAPIGPTGLQLVSADSASMNVYIDAFVGSPQIRFRQAGGTGASPVAIGSGNIMGAIAFEGYDGTAYQQQAGISATSTNVFSSTTRGTRMTFQTTPTGGTAMATAMTLDGSGNLIVAGTLTVGNNANPSLMLEIGAYTTINAPDANSVSPNWAGIHIGNAANPNIYYRNTSHLWQTRNAATNLMTLDGSGNLTIAGFLYHSSGGLGGPTFTTRSAGTRIILWSGLSGTDVDYALGMSGGVLWSSIPNSTAQFMWYSGQTNIMTLGGTGNLTTTGTITSGSTISVGQGGDLVMARTDNAYGAIVRPNTAGLKKFLFCTVGGGYLEEVRSLGPILACAFYANGGQLRMSVDAGGTGYGAMWHVDTANTYLLVTNNNDSLGLYNGLRPFIMDNSNGKINFGNYTGSLAWACRGGTAGYIGGNGFNIEWTGTAQLWIDNVLLGQIAFVSDYRTKENIATLPSMWDKVKALRPISYNRRDCEELLSKGDPTERWGFVAHELQETLTESAASGYKDAPNEVQSPDLPTLLATTVRALQEAMGRIEALEAGR